MKKSRKLFRAKILSLLSKIIAVTFVIVGFYITDRSGTDLIYVGVFILLAFSPVDISVWIDKFLYAKKLKAEKETGLYETDN